MRNTIIIAGLLAIVFLTLTLYQHYGPKERVIFIHEDGYSDTVLLNKPIWKLF